MIIIDGAEFLFSTFVYTVAAISGFNTFPALLRIANNDSNASAYYAHTTTLQATPKAHLDFGHTGPKDSSEADIEQANVSQVDTNQVNETRASTSSGTLEEHEELQDNTASRISEPTAEISNALKEYIAERIASDILLANRRQGLSIQNRVDAGSQPEHMLQNKVGLIGFDRLQDFPNRYMRPLLEDEMFFADFGLLVFSWIALVIFRFAPKLLQKSAKSSSHRSTRTRHSFCTSNSTTSPWLGFTVTYANTSTSTISHLSECGAVSLAAASSLELVPSSTPAPKPASLSLAPTAFSNSSESTTNDDSILSALAPSTSSNTSQIAGIGIRKETNSPSYCPSAVHNFFSDPVTSKFKAYIPPHRRVSRPTVRMEDDSPCANRRVQVSTVGGHPRKMPTSFSATLQGDQSDSDSSSDDFIFPLSVDAVEDWRQRDPMQAAMTRTNAFNPKSHRRTTSADYSMFDGIRERRGMGLTDPLSRPEESSENCAESHRN